ncbi:XRE family transcriptional regulator [Kitasatospora sp. NPDC097691]|uniref:helix-turn-helix domain-containing protein n=1 Tax=Kitasatospora sp. NPDC097691 TaxID=3157231 RepID=UPI00332DE66A
MTAEFWNTEPLRDAFAARHMGRVLRHYRAHSHHTGRHGPRGVPQSLLGQWLGLTQAQISRIETGPPVTDLVNLVHYARVLGMPAGWLWFSLPEALPAPQVQAGTVDDERRAVSPDVHRSQAAWRTTRRYLNTHRAQLAAVASQLYPANARLASAPLLTTALWCPPEPVLLDQVRLTWTGSPKLPLFDGSEPEAGQALPLRAPSRRFDRYTQAVRYIAAPSLFENRPSYRLTGIEWRADGSGELSFGLATYFDKLDVSEAIGHEFAAAAQCTESAVSWGALPLRRLINDPFDLDLRAVVPAITTLLLRVRPSGEATFLLHWRDPGKVATAGGLYDTIPAGEFQPSTVMGDPAGPDFDLWRNIVRELNEELLGAPEYDGSGSRPLDYERWPLYRSLQRARAAGRLRAYCFGVGCDALTLAATIPSAMVIADDVFDELFGEVVQTNAEGVTVTRWNGQDTTAGIPFTEQNITRFLTSEPMAPPGAACLALAWKHRALLLGS